MATSTNAALGLRRCQSVLISLEIISNPRATLCSYCVQLQKIDKRIVILVLPRQVYGSFAPQSLSDLQLGYQMAGDSTDAF